MSEHRWRQWLSFFVGIFILATPWIVPLAFPQTGVSEVVIALHGIAGPVIVMVALMSLSFPQAWQGIIKIVLGFWLLLSPWILGFHTEVALSYSDVIAGASVLTLALLGLAITTLANRERF
jgi:hypothetical protein